MVDTTTALAAVLGVGLGLVMVAAPEFVVQAQTAGRLPQDRHGEYGEGGSSERWTTLVRVLGVVVLLGGAYFGYTIVA
jgi:hypothetical protein